MSDNLKKLKFKPRYKMYSPADYYEDDVQTMKKVLLSKGYDVSEADLHLAWKEISEDHAAGWLILPLSEEDLVKTLLNYLSEE